jgi:hypothetical protein
MAPLFISYVPHLRRNLGKLPGPTVRVHQSVPSKWPLQSLTVCSEISAGKQDLRIPAYIFPLGQNLCKCWMQRKYPCPSSL